MNSRTALFLLCFAAMSLPVAADDVLFIGNSFTFGASVPVLQAHGGVPKLVEEIARAQARNVTALSVTSGGKDWTYHLAQPATSAALSSKVWSWVVLQDYSTRPTRVGSIAQFLRDGEIFSDRIAQNSPRAGILLYETWARPAGGYYQTTGGRHFSGPDEMMGDLHAAYGKLREDLAAENKDRPVRVALVGTAFTRSRTEYPGIPLDAADHHHSTAEGYYLAALVIDETLYRQSVVGAPIRFFGGALNIPAGEAAQLQHLADEVAGR